MLIHVVSKTTHEWIGCYRRPERCDIEIPSGVFCDSPTTRSRPALFSSRDETVQIVVSGGTSHALELNKSTLRDTRG
jgi:hypothetical protein